MEFAAYDANGFEPFGDNADTLFDAIRRDPIATVRTMIRQIWASSLRRHYFSSVLKALEMKGLQLLRDVITCWSSTLLMIERVIFCDRPSTSSIPVINSRSFTSISSGIRSGTPLEAFKKILEYGATWQDIIAIYSPFLQQILSAEKTPTLGYALPAFEAMASKWEQLKNDRPELDHHPKGS
ncbi:hypothetical protein B0H14DRAFT_3781897 [Mycena olivaceomarginata]|nr:hypothetical protein B0H14DRAFT_3781897 [Mycena olivaceomarginata]